MSIIKTNKKCLKNENKKKQKYLNYWEPEMYGVSNLYVMEATRKKNIKDKDNTFREDCWKFEVAPSDPHLNIAYIWK